MEMVTCNQLFKWKKKICKKSAIKNSMKKPILLNFVNLPLIFCPRLYMETTSILTTGVQNLFQSYQSNWLNHSTSLTIQIIQQQLTKPYLNFTEVHRFCYIISVWVHVHSQDIQIFILPTSTLFSHGSYCWIYGRTWLNLSPRV